MRSKLFERGVVRLRFVLVVLTRPCLAANLLLRLIINIAWGLQCRTIMILYIILYFLTCSLGEIISSTDAIMDLSCSFIPFFRS